ncbi:NCS2 family permease [Miniphocaeibacter halophilus]|uniref:NCS2 family permease n=1 Tax=Miniphocaeibacter halophilus TaxID=2931922 RepID=A0AC61MT68_9FIRM|nr:NCS2 family permease [Miniphocaeibacter halophilus]QQK08890.1 NCS2 family permease [Miniphocaeibacter halophilus]
MESLERFFKLKERNTNVKTEIIAGITTFVTMAYILPVNMNILSESGLDSGAVFMATALSAVIGTMLMGLFAGLPFAQAPGMGLNAFFAYTVVLTMGYEPSFALAAVLVEGLIFILLSVTNVRTKLMEAIPKQLRLAISAGIGLFIMFIGFQNANIIVGDPATLVAVNPNLTEAATALAIIGLAITIILWIKKVKGSLLIGIFATWILGMVAQVAGWYQVIPDAGLFSLFPSGVVSLPPSLAPTFGLCFTGLKTAFSSPENILQFAMVILTFLYVDIFDTLGTFAGVATKAKLVDENGNFPGAGRAFTSDAIATTCGAILGTSTVTTFVESASGVEEGGRTGLTAVVTAILFLLAIPFFPIIGAIPGFATAPALIMVGIMMCEPMRDFEWDKADVIIPGVFAIIFMVVGYSISAGIMWGVMSYLLVKVVQGEANKPGAVMWVLGVLFVIKLFIFPIIEKLL